MGAVTGEANHQPRVPKGETPAFSYSYASAFIMVTIAFCLDEISGVLSVYIFIIRHKESVKRRHARLTAHKSKSDRIHNYFRRHSRAYSNSSAGGEASMRGSNQPQDCMIDRDTSHMTMLTAVLSNNHLDDCCNTESLNNYSKTMRHRAEGPRAERPRAEGPQADTSNCVMKQDSFVDVDVVPDRSELGHFNLPPPPVEFRSPGLSIVSTGCKPVAHTNSNKVYMCKTTSV